MDARGSAASGRLADGLLFACAMLLISCAYEQQREKEDGSYREAIESEARAAIHPIKQVLSC